MRAARLCCLVVLSLSALAACQGKGTETPASAETPRGEGKVVFERPDFATPEVLETPPAGARHLRVEVGPKGYTPNTFEAAAGEALVLDVVRTAESTCGEYLTVYNTPVKKKLPLNEVVPVAIRMPATGEVVFACGMDMMHGMITVRPQATDKEKGTGAAGAPGAADAPPSSKSDASKPGAG